MLLVVVVGFFPFYSFCSFFSVLLYLSNGDTEGHREMDMEGGKVYVQGDRVRMEGKGHREGKGNREEGKGRREGKGHREEGKGHRGMDKDHREGGKVHTEVDTEEVGRRLDMGMDRGHTAFSPNTWRPRGC